MSSESQIGNEGWDRGGDVAHGYISTESPSPMPLGPLHTKMQGEVIP